MKMDDMLMAQVDIEHGKKRLAGLAILVVGRIAGFIPNAIRFKRIIVFFTVIGAVIAGLSQILRKEFELRGYGKLAAHVHSAQRGGVHPGNNG